MEITRVNLALGMARTIVYRLEWVLEHHAEYEDRALPERFLEDLDAFCGSLKDYQDDSSSQF